MRRPATWVNGDVAAVAGDLDPAGVGMDVDAAADRRGVHRVVVGGDPDVMIVGKAGRPPPAAGRGRRQRNHGGPVRVDTIGGRACNRRCIRLFARTSHGVRPGLQPQATVEPVLVPPAQRTHGQFTQEHSGLPGRAGAATPGPGPVRLPDARVIMGCPGS